MNKKETTIEELFQEIDDIIERLEQPDATLEASFSLYSEGMKRIKECTAKIDAVEKEILILNDNGDIDEI